MKAQLPLVYACSGCSSVAQLANTCALRLDRLGARKRFGVDASEQEESLAWQVIENAIAALSPSKK